MEMTHYFNIAFEIILLAFNRAIELFQIYPFMWYFAVIIGAFVVTNVALFIKKVI